MAFVLTAARPCRQPPRRRPGADAWGREMEPRCRPL